MHGLACRSSSTRGPLSYISKFAPEQWCCLSAPLAFEYRTCQTEGVIALTEAQTWATIGVLSAALIGMITVVTSVLKRTITVQVGSLRNELVTGFDSVRADFRSEIGGLRAEMNARFEVVDMRFESLDRDVQAVANKVFGNDRP